MNPIAAEKPTIQALNESVPNINWLQSFQNYLNDSYMSETLSNLFSLSLSLNLYRIVYIH